MTLWNNLIMNEKAQEEQPVIENLIDSIADLSVQIIALSGARRTREQQLAYLLCPHVVGDRVINNRGEKAEVTEIRYGGSKNYQFFVKRIKNNGDLYIKQKLSYNFEGWI